VGIEFRLREFFAPVTIWRLRRTFERTQWMPPDERRAYQDRLLRATVCHAYERVPYYRDQFDRVHLKPDDIRTAADLSKVPILDRAAVRAAGGRLVARGARPRSTTTTSGTTGEPVTVHFDYRANALEFVYYWRWWSWAGYRLGERFAQVVIEPFLRRPAGDERPVIWQPLCRRLMINAVALAPARAGVIAEALRRYRPRFLKGTFVGLYALARLLAGAGVEIDPMRAAFSTAGHLPPAWRGLIERTFGCQVLDGYGHMERCVAISQCPAGGYHVCDDYGLLELLRPARVMSLPPSWGKVRMGGNPPPPPLPSPVKGEGTAETPASLADDRSGAPPGSSGRRAIGTSLHNRAMPLIRYETGDLVEPAAPDAVCPCGRTLPLVTAIVGRCEDIVITPSGRVVSGLFIVHHHVPGVEFVQFIQAEPDRLIVRICRGADYNATSERALRVLLERLVGQTMRIYLEHVAFEDLERTAAGKVPEVISRLRSEDGTRHACR